MILMSVDLPAVFAEEKRGFTGMEIKAAALKGGTDEGFGDLVVGVGN